MLTKQQLESIRLMIHTDMTQGEIADEVGCHRSTLWAWRTSNKEYQDEYNKQLKLATEIVTQKFDERLDKVVDILYDTIVDPNTGTRERVNGAIYWINRVAGTPTSRLEMSDDREDNNKVSNEDILSAIDDLEETK